MSKLHEKEKKNQFRLTGSLHYYTLLLKEFLLFSTILISIEIIMPIQTTIAIYLIIPFVIHTFKNVRTRLIFFGSCLICFLVFYATSHFLFVMFSSMSFIALGTLGDMKVATKC